MWTTQEELRYLRSIGQHSESAIVTSKTKAEMLRNYLRAAALRTTWGMIDRLVVTLEAEAMLRELAGER